MENPISIHVANLILFVTLMQLLFSFLIHFVVLIFQQKNKIQNNPLKSNKYNVVFLIQLFSIC